MAKDPQAGASPEIDYEKLGTAIGKAIGPLIGTTVGDAVKPLSELLAKQQTPATDDAAAKAAKPLTSEDVGRIVGEQLKTFQQSTQATEQRRQFLDDKLKDVPAAYRNQLGSDPAKWPAEEQQIREQYKADFKALGGKVEDVSGDPPAGAKKPDAVVDTSKLNPVQKIALGLKNLPGPTSPNAAAAAAAGTGGATQAATGAAK